MDSSNNLIFAERIGSGSFSSTHDIIPWDYESATEISRFSTTLRMLSGLRGM